MRANAVGAAVRFALGNREDMFRPAQRQYNELIARLRELRDAPEPRAYDDYGNEAPSQIMWERGYDLAIELLAMLGEE